jgi:CTP synthase (UTP-ammonia lyase)
MKSQMFALSRYVRKFSRYGFVWPCWKLGGTIGDIESAPFVEAMRQFQFRVGNSNFACIHVSLVPDLHGEQKTRPTQTTVHALRGLGLLPDIVRLILLPMYHTAYGTKDRLPFAGLETGGTSY